MTPMTYVFSAYSIYGLILGWDWLKTQRKLNHIQRQIRRAHPPLQARQHVAPPAANA